MKLISRPVGLFLAALLVGCAHPPEANPPASIAPSTASPKSPSAIGVPAISVVLECGKCEVSAEVLDRIRESYRGAAEAAGVLVSATETASLRIELFADRGPSRLIVAAVAGPLAMIFHVDRIKGTLVATGNTEFLIDQTARFPFSTINTVAKEVGESAFVNLATMRGLASRGR
ncbi:MAG: hypothetical protein EAZ30_00780 [Betaproteobacteria bacterium]|nr:MAG: hypothetical protein EAZ30_00780 [Betaproteobacteria bacterium]